jgi:acetyl esterase/lipase
MQNERKDANYLGAISLAPVADVGDWAESMNCSPKYRGYVAFVAFGIKAVYPEFETSEILTPQADKLMPVVEKGGWFVTLATFADKEIGIPVGKVLKAGWKKSKHFQEFRNLTALGEKPSYGPVLLLQGEAEKTIPTEQTDALYKRMTKQKTMVDYRTYPDLDHDSLVFGSFRDQLRWVQDRFTGKPVAKRNR